MVNATRWVCTRCRPYACRDPYRRVLNDMSHRKLCLLVRSCLEKCLTPTRWHGECVTCPAGLGMLGAAGSNLRNPQNVPEERLRDIPSRNPLSASSSFLREPAVLFLVRPACMAASLLPRCSPCASFGVLRPGAGTRTRRNLTIKAAVVEVPTQYSKVGCLLLAAQQTFCSQPASEYFAAVAL